MFIKKIKNLLIIMLLAFCQPVLYSMQQETTITKYRTEYPVFEDTLQQNAITLIKIISKNGAEKLVCEVQFEQKTKNGGRTINAACSYFRPYIIKDKKRLYFDPKDNSNLFAKELNFIKSAEKCPNIISYIAHINIPETQTYCILSELAKTDLNSYIFKNEFELNKSFETKLNIAIDSISGILYMHNQKKVHRDIKPANMVLVINESGTITAKLIDFTFFKEIPPGETCILTKEFMGSFEFTAPENIIQQANRNYLTISEANDIYAFGVTLYMLFYEKPFDQELKDIFAEQNSLDPKKVTFKNRKYHNFYFDQLINENWKPQLNDSLVHPTINKIISDCWNPDPTRRPRARIILDKLNILKKILKSDEKETEI